MITLRKLTKSFGSRTLWEDLDLTVEAGRMLALVGASGTGKTTLLNCMGLLETPTAGQVVFEDTDLTRLGTTWGTCSRTTPSSRTPPSVKTSTWCDTGVEGATRPKPWNGSDWADGRRKPCTISPVGNSNASPWPDSWSNNPPWCWRTNRPVPWTETTGQWSWSTCGR